MKKIILLPIYFICFSIFAQGIKFEEKSFNLILAKAKKENKIIFLDAYASWCRPCKLMEKTIFPLQSVGDYYNSNFINMKIDMEKGEGIDLAKKYNVNAFPTYLFINGDGEVIYSNVGDMGEEDFIQLAKDAQNPNERLLVLKQKFENGERDPLVLKKIAKLLITKDENKDFMEKVLICYYQQKTNLDQEDIFMLISSIGSTDSPLYKIFQTKKDYLKERDTEIDKDNKINILLQKSYNKDTKKMNYNTLSTQAQKLLGKDEAQSLLQKVKAHEELKNAPKIK